MTQLSASILAADFARLEQDCRRVLAALRQLGLVTDVDLVTYRELEPEDYAWEAEPTDAGPQEAVPTAAVAILPDGGAVQSRTAENSAGAVILA